MDVAEAIGRLGHYDSLLRERAMATLIDAGAAAVPSLVAALDLDSSAVRGHAALCLGRIGERTAILPLAEKVGSLAAGDDRTFCVRALADLAGPELAADTTLGDFFASLLRDHDHFVRALAARALGRLGNPRAKVALARAERDREPWVRDAAAEALGALALGSMAKTEERQGEDALTLEKIADSSPIDGDVAEAVEIEDAGPSDAVHESAAHSEHAVSSLPEPTGPLPFERIAEPFERLFAREATTRELAAEDLAALGSPAAPALIAALEKRRATLTAEAAQVLGRLADAAAVPLLLAAATDGGGHADVRAVSWRALARVCVGTEKDILEALLADRAGDPYVRAATAAALGAFKSIRAVRALLLRLSDSHELVREDAAKALARAACPGVPDLGAALIAALRKERDEGVRAALILAVQGAIRAGAAEGDIAAKAAEDLLSQSAWSSRLAGLELLAASGRRSQEGTKTLALALESSERSTRLVACAVAGRLAPPGYAPVVHQLITLAGDGDRDTSRAAILALGEVGGPSAAVTLRHLRGDGDPEVADAARAAITRLPAEGAEVIPLRRET